MLLRLHKLRKASLAERNQKCGVCGKAETQSKTDLRSDNDDMKLMNGRTGRSLGVRDCVASSVIQQCILASSGASSAAHRGRRSENRGFST